MSLYLLLFALQADAPLDPPPLKIKPVVVQPTTQTPPPPTAPTVNPTIIYTPAPKPAPVVTPAPAAPAEVAAPLAGLSEASRQRIAAERKLNSERVVAHRRELAAAQEAVGRALAANPLDMAALKAALEARDRAGSAYRERLTVAVLDLLQDIPPAERAIVARAVIQGELPARPAEVQQPPKPDPTPVGR